MNLEEALREAYRAGRYAEADDEGKIWRRRPSDPIPEPSETKDEAVARLLVLVNRFPELLSLVDEDKATIRMHTSDPGNPAPPDPDEIDATGYARRQATPLREDRWCPGCQKYRPTVCMDCGGVT